MPEVPLEYGAAIFPPNVVGLASVIGSSLPLPLSLLPPSLLSVFYASQGVISQPLKFFRPEAIPHSPVTSKSIQITLASPLRN
jgi:hypothetical protein